MTANMKDDVHPGAIVHAERFPFDDGSGGGKARYALVISANRNRVVARGIFTKKWKGRRRINATYETGLHHDSYLDSQLVEIPVSWLTHYVGEAPYDFDPFGDFGGLVLSSVTGRPRPGLA